MCSILNQNSKRDKSGADHDFTVLVEHILLTNLDKWNSLLQQKSMADAYYPFG